MRYQNFVEQVTAWAEENEYDVREQYSGRGMYGKTCLGVVVPSLSVIAELYFNIGWSFREASEESDEPYDCETPNGFEWDQMGREYIVYWRQVKMPEKLDKRIEFPSRGSTYCNAEFGVYVYDEYPEGSVLEGQQRRKFEGSYKTLEEAQAAHPDAEVSDGCGFQEPNVSHLPEE